MGRDRHTMASVAPEGGAPSNGGKGACHDFLISICFFYGPVWNEKGRSQIGGIMTLIFPVLIVAYAVQLGTSIADAPAIFSFKGVGQTAEVTPAMAVYFKCTSAAGCITVPYPCDSTCVASATSTGRNVMASGAEMQLTTPFIAMQNSDRTYNNGASWIYEVGIYQNSINSGAQKIGEFKGELDSTDTPIDVTIPSGRTHSQVCSAKTIPTIKTKTDDTTTIELAPDDADCTADQLAELGRLLQDVSGGTASWTSNVMYPTGASGSGQVEHWGVAICTSSFYLKVREEKPVLSWTVILSLVGGAFTVFFKFINQFVKGCTAFGAFMGWNGDPNADLMTDNALSVTQLDKRLSAIEASMKLGTA